MNLVKETLYLKVDQNNVVNKADVTIKDVAKIECGVSEVKAKINQIRLYKFDTASKARKQSKTFSVLKVIELIHKEYPQLTIFVLGETDFIVHYIARGENRIGQFVKITLICMIAFIGAAFMIITFCKEVSMTVVLDFIYSKVVGRPPGQYSILDISFCVGLPLGVLVFYNHFGKKKITDDPTPVQVAMRKYEQDVDMTYIESSSREGKSIDVD